MATATRPSRPATAESRHNPVEDPLWRLVLLHLAPGWTLGAFILFTVPLLDNQGVDPLFALFGGIATVIVPIELGYLAWRAHRTDDSWSPLRVVEGLADKRVRPHLAHVARLAAWFLLTLAISGAVLDAWLADHVFSWLPAAILQFSDMEGGSLGGLELAMLLIVAFLFNGVLGPVTEELYFRGHLLPRLRRYQSRAPLISTALFALYHLWTPWRWPAILVGFLPTTRAVHRTGNLRISMLVHVTINVLFLVGMLALFTSD
jgi:uncharacterized protein